MRLAVDARRLLGSRAGVGRYLTELLREWASSPLPFDEIVLYSPEAIPADALPTEHPYRLEVVPFSGPGGGWEHYALARAARGADLLFCPSNTVPLLWRGRSVVTLHDVAQEILTHTFPRRSRLYRGRLYRSSARRASLVLTDSASSKRDIERIYAPPTPVLAIPLGVDERIAGASAEEERRVRDRLGLEGPIVLFVGKFSRRRNLPTLVRAFARLRANGGPPGATLVLVGSDHLGLRLDDLVRDLGLGAAVRLPGHVPDDELRALYRAADVFVYPSEYEGFGLPPLEAMAAGTPVVALDNSSIPEVVGDAGVLLPGATEEGLAGELLRLLGDESARAELSSRGRERARQFTWRRTATETLAALVDVAGATTAGRQPWLSWFPLVAIVADGVA